VHEKSQIQGLNRPSRQCRCGRDGQRALTHDYTRHGATSLFVALEVASGKVHGRCFPRHTHVKFVAFMKSPAHRYPNGRFI